MSSSIQLNTFLSLLCLWTLTKCKLKTSMSSLSFETNGLGILLTGRYSDRWWYGDAVMGTGQWLYHPEEAEKSGGGSWQIRDTRELFYSTHHVEVPAQVCNAQVCGAFCPCQQAASRLQKTSVQQVYDAVQQKLSTDKDHN